MNGSTQRWVSTVNTVNNWTSSDLGSAPVDLLTATTLIVLHDQVHIDRPPALVMTRLVTATRARAADLGNTADALAVALIETMTARMAAAVPPPTGPIPSEMIAEEITRWADPGHPAYHLAQDLAQDPDQVPDWLPTQYLPLPG